MVRRRVRFPFTLEAKRIARRCGDTTSAGTAQNGATPFQSTTMPAETTFHPAQIRKTKGKEKVNKGSIRHSGAKVTTVKCPKCEDVIVYNGNYFCNSFDAIEYDKKVKVVVIIPGTCDWALPHPVFGKKNKDVVDALYRTGHMSESEYFS